MNRVLFLVALSLWGCSRGETPQLVSASFQDDVVLNGKVDAGETVLLTFDRPLHFDKPQRTGIELLPTGHSLGAYEVQPASSRHQLAVVIGIGKTHLESTGLYADGEEPAASGIRVDFDALAGLRDSAGRRLVGKTEVVDVAAPVHPPARLLSVFWEDLDRSYTVSERDRLLLEFDRAVEIAGEIKRKHGRYPPDMFILPVPGDRLDDGDRPSRLQATREERVVAISLGSSPRLSVRGNFHETSPRVAGSSSGVALKGTTIRPHRGLLDEFGQGVWSDGIVDLEGECEPFFAARSPARGGARLGHTATALPDGRILIAGGIVLDGEAGPRYSQEAFVYDPGSDGWSGPYSMRSPRHAHTATYFEGEDGREGTVDDFVILAGGFDGQRAVGSFEVFLPFPAEGTPRFVADLEEESSSARFYHTAEPIPETTDVLLVGGRYGGFLKATIDRVRIHVEPDGAGVTVRTEVKSVGELRYPRHFHDSLLFEDSGHLFLFVYGGSGREGTPTEMLTPQTTLAAPELLRIRPDWTSERIPLPGDPAAGPREGHRLILLREEWPTALLVGGRSQALGTQAIPPFLTVGEEETTRQAYRLEFQPYEDPPVRYLAAGELAATRHNFATVLLPDGKVLVVGGNEGGEPSARVDLYDPDHDRFESFCRDLISPREGCAVAPLPDDRWLIFGGTDRSISAEIFQWQE